MVEHSKYLKEKDEDVGSKVTTHLSSVNDDIEILNENQLLIKASIDNLEKKNRHEGIEFLFHGPWATDQKIMLNITKEGNQITITSDLLSKIGTKNSAIASVNPLPEWCRPNQSGMRLPIAMRIMTIIRMIVSIGLLY